MFNADSPSMMPTWHDPKSGAPLRPEYVMEAFVRLDVKIQSDRRSDKCWLFFGRKVSGYGTILIGSTPIPAHRVVAALALNVDVRDLNGVQVRHHCSNPTCCNPDHLYVKDPRTGTHVPCMPVPSPINEKRANQSSQSTVAVSDPIAQLLEARMAGLQAELLQRDRSATPGCGRPRFVRAA